MNNLKIKIYKRLFKEVSEKYDSAEDFINNRIVWFTEIFSCLCQVR